MANIGYRNKTELVQEIDGATYQPGEGGVGPEEIWKPRVDDSRSAFERAPIKEMRAASAAEPEPQTETAPADVPATGG